MKTMKTVTARKQDTLTLVFRPIKLRGVLAPAKRVMQDRRTKRQGTRRAKVAAALRD